MAVSNQQNGSAEAPIDLANPTVVGINFGNSYASISVLNKQGNPDCIANEDGERQIACAVSFHGEEIYIGNQAKHQLVKNAQNTITGFRNLLGKKFSQIDTSKPTTSAPVIEHPEQPDTAAYKVQILQSAPLPLPASTTTTQQNTPLASRVATPRSEPTPATRILSVSEVTTIFIKSLLQSAEDFLGKKVQGAVITVPAWFTSEQKKALEDAATEAGVSVLQLLEEAGAAAVAVLSNPTAPASTTTSLSGDRTQLVVDLGSSALALSLLSIRQGLIHSLATLSDHTLGGDAIDSKLIKFFAKEFTKKTKIPLTVAPAPADSKQDQRAEAKLRLAVEHTKRTVSASSGAATCSVESLKDGIDYTGSINRMRFDMEVRNVYAGVGEQVKTLVSSAGLDLFDVDEIVYVGGSASLPGLDEHLAGIGFREDIVTPFSSGSVVGGGVGDPTTLLSRGAVVQAKLLAGLGESSEEEKEVKAAFHEKLENWTGVKVTSKSIGLVFPETSAEGQEENALGGQWIPLVLRETVLPCRRTVRFGVEVGEEGKVGFELWQVDESIKITLEKPPKFEPEDGEPEEEDEEEEEDIEVKDRIISKDELLGAALLESKKARNKKTTLEVQILIAEDGKVDVSASEVGGEKVTLAVPPIGA
ncbi:Hsp70 protein-domain-containing protein [Irpex rosettiformis]|uniref:Hsp70 protein-domain-containing protein n=1 Tax=Irpex rosettiformis TaxID=378272 RepID=A0ACB8U5X7_9APHY|nr:Hsp70 protein-domain-containing protein [Irpex rosettiformis]